MKKLLSVLLMIAMAFTMVTPVAFAEDTNEIGFSYGAPIRYEPTIKEAHTELTLTSYEDGRPILLVSAEGSGEVITTIIDINKEEIIHEFHHRWGGYLYNGVVSDDGVIYFGSYKSLGKYDPRTKELTEFAQIPDTEWNSFNGMIIDDEREMIYAPDNSRGYIMQISEKTGELSILANMTDNNAWASGTDLAQVGDYIYSTGKKLDGADNPYMWKISKDTGEATKIENPTDDKFALILDCSYIGKYVFANFYLEDGSNTAYVYDTEAEEWIDFTFNYNQVMCSSIHEGKRAFLWNNYIHTIDENLNIEEYPQLKFNEFYRGVGPWVELDDPDLPGYTFFTAQFNGNIYMFNLNAKETKKLNVELTGLPLYGRTVYLNPMDDTLYIGAFKGGFGAAMDTKTGDIQYFPAVQPEGMTHDPETGFFYHGDYPGAQIYEIDPSKEFGKYLDATPENGKRDEYASYNLGYLGQDQDRPFDLEVVGRELYIGTLVSGGNENGGALSVINLDTGEKQVFQDFVEDHSVLTITEKDGIIYGTTTTTKNVSMMPAPGPCKIFTFDTKTKEFLKIVDFKVDTVDGNISSAHSLEFSPDGRLFGWTHGIYFELDPETLEVINYNVYNRDRIHADVGFGTQLWGEHKVYFDESGYMIRDGEVVDPDTLEIVALPPALGYEWEPSYFAGFDSNGDAWFVTWDTTPVKVPVRRDGSLEAKANSGVYFKTGDNKMFVNGEATAFTSYEENGEVMVPMRALSSVTGGLIGYVHADRKATLINAGGKILSFYARTGDVLIDDKDAGFTMTATDGVSYVPFDSLCEFLGKKAAKYGGINFVDDGMNPYASEELAEYINNNKY
ncbi:MAG: hypothetical protein Q4B31_02025 [Clostridia bacterium]|nr:hypothetical protein [Clostridia bacterium]